MFSIKKISLILLYLSSFSAFAMEKTFNKIEFLGNNRTEESVLNLIVEINSGDKFQTEKLEKAVQQLKNTHLFSKVEVSITGDKDDSNKIDVKFNLEEKWAIIPVPIAYSAGGVSRYGVALMDYNFLGRFYQLTNYFYLQNSKPNFGSTFVNNFTFNLPLISVLSFNYVDNKNTIYNKNKEVGYYSVNLIQLEGDMIWKFNDYINLGAGLKYENAGNVNNELSNDEKIKNTQNGIEKPKSFDNLAFVGKGGLGKIDHDSYLAQGAQLSSTVTSTAGMYQGNDNEDYTKFENTFLAYYKMKLYNHTNFALRIQHGQSNSKNLIRKMYLGADQIRGFQSMQYSGNEAIYSNVEVRQTVYEGNYVSLQVVPFFDVGYIGSDFGNAINNQSLMSYGVGLRLPLMQLAGLIVRMDYGFAVTPENQSGFSFGLSQFF
ncbi:POTRA domain-containing protein [Pigmentibacter sp. JX0631]|uniref:POTRA domain-containing protein n=1 Tax=Pigmentibacter sp. JX0631 TaxID=2976982 RepID=UPI00246903C5|nr:POTRA domain-containing protein [Pigmentibacter sp. JX0631]WGL58500.1 POTRA domain-containing protein [Pigmentibacter sp. JX0631]